MTIALLVIDVQMALAIDDANGGERSCREAEGNIGQLLSAFRQTDHRVIHIHHYGLDDDDPFNEKAVGSKVQPFAKPNNGEKTYVKNGSSAFIGTTLEKDLRKDNIKTLILCGATANHCVETATRMGSNLGFDCYYVGDAVWAYGVKGPDGTHHSGEQIHSVSMANIEGEFARVVTTKKILADLASF